MFLMGPSLLAGIKDLFELIVFVSFQSCCHLPLQEGDIFDNKLEFSEIEIAIGQGFR